MQGVTIRRILIGLIAALLAWTQAAIAEYPEKLVRIIVAFPPGGATDVVARALGSRLSQLWGQRVIIENKPGAGGNIGADYVAKSPTDGYTLLLASPAEIAINPYLYANMPFDPTKDLAPVTKVTSAPLVLVLNPSVPAKSVAELIEYLKSQKQGTTFASSGTGGPQHLAGEQFRLLTGTNLIHVPYKGGAPAIADLLGGQVQMFFAGLPPALPHIHAGKIRAIAVTTAKRSSLLPQVPSLEESGLRGFDIENWQGVFVPAGTPASIVAKIARDIAGVADNKAFAELLAAQGAIPSTLSPTDFATFVREESRKFSRLVKESGARAD
jgi:tripartite-type tricarboxylate transporter receptor subunit TctC